MVQKRRSCLGVPLPVSRMAGARSGGVPLGPRPAPLLRLSKPLPGPVERGDRLRRLRRRHRLRRQYRRRRGGGWKERARCGRVVPDLDHGQPPGGDGDECPGSHRGMESSPASGSAEALRSSAIAPSREFPRAPKANVAIRLHAQPARVAARTPARARRPERRAPAADRQTARRARAPSVLPSHP
jgi:hypothetical protein